MLITGRENRPQTHQHIGMRGGQKGGQKGPIGDKNRQKSEKKSKKVPEIALPILTFRSSNPLGASARADLPSETGRNPPKPTQNRPPTYRPCAMCSTGREHPCPPEPSGRRPVGALAEAAGGGGSERLAVVRARSVRLPPARLLLLASLCHLEPGGKISPWVFFVVPRSALSSPLDFSLCRTV